MPDLEAQIAVETTMPEMTMPPKSILKPQSRLLVAASRNRGDDDDSDDDDSDACGMPGDDAAADDAGEPQTMPTRVECPEGVAAGLLHLWRLQAVRNDKCKLYTCGCCCGTFCLGAFVGIILLLCSIVSLGQEEQVVVYGREGKTVHNGPGKVLVLSTLKKEFRQATRLNPREYAVIKDIKTGTIRHEAGPQLLFIGAYDEKTAVKPKVVLQKHEYMRLVDTLTGYERIESGPQTMVPRPLEDAPNGTESAVVLGTDLAVVSFNKTTGVKRLVTSGGVFIPSPYEVILEVRTATLLSAREFALVRNTMTGLLRHEEGALLLQVGAYDQVVHVKPKLVLERDQYIRLMDRDSGKERIELAQRPLCHSPLRSIQMACRKPSS
jgi:hypothetical protein